MPLPLADQVFAALSQRNPDSFPSKDPAERRRIAARYKDLMRSARRYYLDDDVTRAATTLGYQHPDILAGMLFRARTPFERIWVEWPLAPALEEVGQEKTEDAPERIGVLVEQLHEEEPLYRMTMLSCIFGNPHVSAVSVLYHLTQPLKDITGDAAVAAHRHHHITTGVQQDKDGGGYITSDIAFLLGSAYSHSAQIEDEEERKFRKVRCESLGSHATFVFSPMSGEAVRRSINSGDGRRMAAMQLQMELEEHAGTWRNVIAALALINAHNTITTDTPHRAGASRSRLVTGQIVPFLDHHVVKLRLPKKQAIKKLIRDHRDAIPRRRHEVSGYWSERHDSGDPSCDHVWVDVTATRQTCDICGRRQWWTKNYARGDAERGFVTKDRLVVRR